MRVIQGGSGKKRGSLFVDRVIRNVQPALTIALELGQTYKGGQVIAIDRANCSVTIRIQRPR